MRDNNAPPAPTPVPDAPLSPVPTASPGPSTALPPIGERPTLKTEPIRVDSSSTFRRVSAPAPRTQRYDVHVYSALGEDTWEKISRKEYGDERCADALREFNRQYPQASERLRNHGQLAPGERVYIPPLKVLMDKHQALIRQPERPAASPASPPSASTPGAPAPLPDSVSSTPSAPNPAAPAPSAPAPTPVVPAAPDSSAVPTPPGSPTTPPGTPPPPGQPPPPASGTGS
jgi:hypothetical protein